MTVIRIGRSRAIFAVALVATTTLLGGCGIGYYWQASMGHLELMRSRQPVAEVIDDPATDPDIRAKLRLTMAALDFAHAELGLPDNGSYRVYANTNRQFVVWNVVVAPEFSLVPRTWCFPVAGCVSYRGYFAEAEAHKFAAGPAADGDDVFVGGVAAYSTLGRFKDPILNTMMVYPDYQLTGLIFHELAHQRVYVKDDTRFNEGFASFVEREGLRRWLHTTGADAQLCRYQLSLQRRGKVRLLVSDFRVRLEALYALDLAPEKMRDRKAAIFAELVVAYGDLRSRWSGPPYFDFWFEGVMNNARLAASSTYADYVPVFAILLDEVGGDLEALFTKVDELAQLDAPERAAAMRDLLERPAPIRSALSPGCSTAVH